MLCCQLLSSPSRVSCLPSHELLHLFEVFVQVGYSLFTYINGKKRLGGGMQLVYGDLVSAELLERVTAVSGK